MKRRYLLLLVLLSSLLAAPVLAQGNSELVVTGTVTVIDETTIQVGGLTVDISGVTDIVLEDGMVVTVSGSWEGTTMVATSIVVVEPTEQATEAPEEATPEATEEPGAVDVDVTIVIEGPVKSIEANVVTIYNFEIELPESDPRITVIQLGDMLHVRGHHKGDRHLHMRGPIVIVALVFDFVDVDVVVFENQVWRDTLSCVVVPPVWADALAIHWHSRCDAIIVSPSLPADCKVTGMGGIKCSGRH